MEKNEYSLICLCQVMILCRSFWDGVVNKVTKGWHVGRGTYCLLGVESL